MTHGTIGRKIPGNMIRIRDTFIIWLMAAETFPRQIELIPGVTIIAVKRGMNAPELIAAGLDMVE